MTGKVCRIDTCRIYVGGIRACKYTDTAQVALIYLKHQPDAGCHNLSYTAAAESVPGQISRV